MENLIIRDVGPIKNVEINLKRFNFFIGPQSCGKSTIAKIFSTCLWVEKEVATTLNEKAIDSGERFKKLIEEFHRMDGYFNPKSFVRYETNVIIIEYKKGILNITLKPGINYNKQKICYIPSERNMVTLPELQNFEFGPTNLRSFLFDWFSAREYYIPDKKSSILSLGVKYFYEKNELKFKDYIEHNNGASYKIPLSKASSGLQSVVPLLIMLDYYSQEYYNRLEQKTTFEIKGKENNLRQKLFDAIILKPLYPDFNEENRDKLMDDFIENAEKDIAARNIDTKYGKAFNNYLESLKKLTNPNKTTFVIEEPEQNLYPNTQLSLIENIIKICNQKYLHDFTITTHSPYIINFLNVLIMRHYKSKDAGVVGLNPEELNVFSVQENGYLMDRMQKNEETGFLSVNTEDLTETMREMYDEYVGLK
jgi:hypothetical protein